MINMYIINGTWYNKVKRKDNLIDKLFKMKIDNWLLNYGRESVIKELKSKDNRKWDKRIKEKLNYKKHVSMVQWSNNNLSQKLTNKKETIRLIFHQL